MNPSVSRAYFRRAARMKKAQHQAARLPRQLYPERIESQYNLALTSIVDFMKKRVDATVAPLLPKLAEAYPRAARADASEPEKANKYYLAFVYTDSWADANVLHCTHKYLGALNPSEVKNVEKIVDRFFVEKFTELPGAVFRNEEFFGPEENIRVLTPDESEASAFKSFDPLLWELEDAVGAGEYAFRPHVTTDKDAVDQPFKSYALISKKGIHRTWPKAIRADADDMDTLAEAFRQVRIETEQEFTETEIRRLARLAGSSVAEWNSAQVNNQLSGIVEVDVVGAEPWLARELGAFVVENVNLISSIEDEYLGQVERLISTSIRSGLRVEEIEAELIDRYDVSKSRASLIARDQVGKLNGQMTELRQRDLGIDKYRWRTSGDARVRESHRANATADNGFGPGVFEWSDPPETGHPGDDFQCRCWAEPVINFEDSASEEA